MAMIQRLMSAIIVFSRLAAADGAADEDWYFLESVQPILKQRCYECHSHEATEISSGLTLDWKSGWEQGGTRGPAIVPGDAAAMAPVNQNSRSSIGTGLPSERCMPIRARQESSKK